jgi:predicted GIY-YIG superfamily endonuclease/proteasome lid subunit RPN8/RPN11
MPFYTYLLRCNDGSYYAGHTDDLEVRMSQHQSGTLPGYTAQRLPVTLVWSESFQTRDDAFAVERNLKGWSRAKKEALIAGDWDQISMLARGLRQAQPERGLELFEFPVPNLTPSAQVELVEAHALTITRAAHAAMLNAAAHAAPEEACGLLLGESWAITEARPAANVAPDPRAHFEIDPAALIVAHRAERSGGPDVIGYFHSHPNGRPDPSAQDRAQASGDGRVWAIVACNAVKFWQDTPSGFEPLSYCVVDG